MLRKQRKLQLWRRFGYVIFIIIKSGELLLWFSPRIINGLRSYIKHSKGCFIRYPNTLKLVKKTRLRLVFSTTSQCLDIGWNTLPRVWYITSPQYLIIVPFVKHLYNIKTISSRQLMKIKAHIKSGIITWSNTKFFKLTS